MPPAPLPPTLRIAIGCVLSADEVARIADASDRFEVLYDPGVHPPRRFPGDLYGPPDWRCEPDKLTRFLDMCARAHVLFGLPYDSPALLRRVVPVAPDLFWVHTMQAGGGAKIRAANLAPADLDRITVTTSAGLHARALAEFALLGVLAGAKELPWLQAQQRDHVWAKRHLLRQVGDMTAVIVGMGGIGREVAARLSALGTTVIGINRTPKDVPGVEMHVTDDLLAQAALADVLINCLPSAVGTDHLISEDVLAATRPGCIVVSLGRGTCLDEDALARLLASGHIGFAALDVTAQEPLDPASPLWDLPNVLISPHMAAVTADEADRTIGLFLDNAARLLDGRSLRNVMDKQLFY